MIFDFLAKARNVDGERVVVNVAVGFPELSHKLLAADDFAAVLHKREQNAKFVFGKLDSFTRDNQRSLCDIESRAVILDDLTRCGKVVSPPQNRVDFRHQHRQIKRLCDKIIAAHIHREHDVHIVRRGREKNDGRFRDFADLLAPVKSVVKGKPDV